jgi:hypothetical protein
MRMTRHSDLGAGKTLGWAGATPPLAAFSRPKTSWGRSSPVLGRRVRQHRVLPAPGEEKAVTEWEESNANHQ